MESDIEISFFNYSFCTKDFVSKLDRMVLPYIDLTYCVKGKMCYFYEGEEYILHSGDAILYPKGSIRIRKEGNSPALYASFNVGYSGSFEPKIKGVIRRSLCPDTVAILESVRKSHESLKNPDLWQRLYQLTEYHKVRFIWVKGHNGHDYNERCDALATSYADSFLV